MLCFKYKYTKFILHSVSTQFSPHFFILVKTSAINNVISMFLNTSAKFLLRSIRMSGFWLKLKSTESSNLLDFVSWSPLYFDILNLAVFNFLGIFWALKKPEFLLWGTELNFNSLLLSLMPHWLWGGIERKHCRLRNYYLPVIYLNQSQ